MPCGEIGNYLFRQMVEFNNKLAHIPHWPHGEMWGLGDSPTIGVLMEESEKTDVFDMMRAPTIAYKTMKYSFDNNNRSIRVYNQVNARLTLEDFLPSFPSISRRSGRERKEGVLGRGFTAFHEKAMRPERNV